MAIKIFLFDLGQVLFNIDSLSDDMYDIFKPKDKSQFFQMLNREMHPVFTGEMKISQFWYNLAKEYKVKTELVKGLWIDGFEDKIHLNKQLYHDINKLRENYIVCSLSNTIDEHIKILNKDNILDIFHHNYLSYQLNMSKKYIDIFEYVLKDLNCRAEEVLYFDDVTHFVDISREVGINSYLYTNMDSFYNSIKKYNIKL